MTDDNKKRNIATEIAAATRFLEEARRVLLDGGWIPTVDPGD